MPDKNNFILGFGERLTAQIAAPGGHVPKNNPYTFDEARERLLPLVAQAVEEMDKLPATVCPQDQTVASITLHPAYVAKSYYPGDLIKNLGLRAVGSRSRSVTPEQSARKKTAAVVTTEIFVAGSRTQFREFAAKLSGWTSRTAGVKDILKIEDFRAITSVNRLKPIQKDVGEVLLEIVLHADSKPESDFIVKGFTDYLDTLEIKNDQNRFLFASGLCFMPLRVPREFVEQVTNYSFLRVAREMPKLRPPSPVTRTVSPFDFTVQLPTDGPLDPNLRVAIFDGGVSGASDMAGLERWVSSYESKDLSDGVDSYISHGHGVTSAFLFGTLEKGKVASVPYAFVDHYRVLDEEVANGSDDLELFTVLQRIVDVMKSGKYKFMNLSLGPNAPLEDDDVSAWTSVMDDLLAGGNILATVAVGNTGESDHDTGLDKIQPPSDCVNTLSVGACDSRKSEWKRAPYSSIGPGRCPGIVKPDVLEFGGSENEPFVVLDALRPGRTMPVQGTSFGSPLALRTAVGIRAYFGDALDTMALKALLIHHAEDADYARSEVGWGRVQTDIGQIVLTEDTAAQIVYQGNLSPGTWLRVPIPMIAEPISGLVTIRATICYASATDPQDAVNYTRAGVETRFRPNEDARADPSQLYPDTKPFFQAKDFGLDMSGMRSDAHKWETVLSKSRRMKGGSLKNPEFNLHYNARQGGHATTEADEVAYAMVITVEAPNSPNLYNGIVTRYQTQLQPVVPIIQVPLAVQGAQQRMRF